MVKVNRNHIRSMTFVGKLFIVVLTLSCMFFVNEGNWLVKNSGKISFLIDADKSQIESEEVEVTIDKYVKEHQNIIKHKPISIKKQTTIQPNTLISLYPDVTTPPPEHAH